MSHVRKVYELPAPPRPCGCEWTDRQCGEGDVETTLHECYHHSRVSDLAKQARSDALTLALRLYGEPDESFAPETLEVMRRLRPIVYRERMKEGAR